MASSTLPASASCSGGGARCAGFCTPDGLARAYREHGPLLLARARRMLSDTGLAEEAVQETYLRAWRACSSFDPTQGPPLRAWLCTISSRVVIDAVRARARRPRLLHVEAADEPDRALGWWEDDDLGRRELLRDALGRISAEHRFALVETIVLGRAYRDVAAELGVPSGTVKSRVHYAVRHLRRLLDQAQIEPVLEACA